jgi:two-component system, NarL family, nitrate/nitrite response regulator NarL
MEREAVGSGRLPEAFLDELSAALSRLAPAQAGAGFVPLVRLARRLPAGASITVDFTRRRQLCAPLVVLRVREDRSDDRAWAVLTPRERTVARLLVVGTANKVIAARLGLTLGTVKDHVHRILVKTAQRNRAAFAAAFSGHGSHLDQS